MLKLRRVPKVRTNALLGRYVLTPPKLIKGYQPKNVLSSKWPDIFTTSTARSAVRFFLPKLVPNFPPAVVALGKRLKYHKT